MALLTAEPIAAAVNSEYKAVGGSNMLHALVNDIWTNVSSIISSFFGFSQIARTTIYSGLLLYLVIQDQLEKNFPVLENLSARVRVAFEEYLMYSSFNFRLWKL